MKLKDLMEKYGEYELDSTSVVGENGEFERIVIDLTKPKPKSIWDLHKFDNYFLVGEGGGVMVQRFGDDYLFDPCAIEVGNVFLTKEEALKDVERRKVETLLLKHGGRRWFKNGKENLAIRYNHVQSSFEYGYLNVTQYSSCIYFDTKGEAENAVNEIGKERLKKALFEVR